ncbi:glutamine amidotransferase [Formivibrio citricus]|uniref:Imidazole glycerol phosphate synthase subunit HisH n=1 Tax=Formivibrio citricus TaxID=83765 RepID=A0A1I4XVZ1_9NEIS|nr:imidazole glycerol phosphate synthase subunit HisH [Formivibrio citricus]SFN29975.1 glutamine amidotransferase [Formivibrio citricus]
MIGIVDYGVGNLASVRNAFDRAGYEAELCSRQEELGQYERLVLPGVGSFRSAMELLEQGGWVHALKTYAATKKPMLGICLGMQLMFDYGEEHGGAAGLGLIPGTVVHLEPAAPNKVPHVGWNSLNHAMRHSLLEGVKPVVDFYFVHSYHCVPKNPEHILATCDFGGEFVAAVVAGNVAGMQFHPEKSQPAGIRILENFAEWEPQC